MAEVDVPLLTNEAVAFPISGLLCLAYSQRVLWLSRAHCSPELFVRSLQVPVTFSGLIQRGGCLELTLHPSVQKLSALFQK